MTITETNNGTDIKETIIISHNHIKLIKSEDSKIFLDNLIELTFSSPITNSSTTGGSILIPSAN